ncbi:MAG: NYN domain-containing protein, partial [Clostridia bacterium]|nr:NYN domain-containing protein [Clostridia bacterium]
HASYYVVEKGTDINLAAHVLTKGFLNAYDTAVIVSADTDYISVMDLLNIIGKTVVIAGVVEQNLAPFNNHYDKKLIIDDALFNRCLR